MASSSAFRLRLWAGCTQRAAVPHNDQRHPGLQVCATRFQLQSVNQLAYVRLLQLDHTRIEDVQRLASFRPMTSYSRPDTNW